MPGADPTGGPRAATLVAAVAAGIALGATGALAAGASSGEAGPNLLLGGLEVPAPEGRSDLERMTVGLTVHNQGSADFDVAGVRVPGWALAEPDAVDTTIPAGRWVALSLDLVVDCSASVTQLDVELVAADGGAVALERNGMGAGGLASIHLRACVLQAGTAAPGVSPAVETVTVRTDAVDGVAHVDIGVLHEVDSEMEFQLGAVTGHASGFTVELQERLTELEARARTTVTTNWRVRDCGGAAGMSGTGAPDPSSSGNFEGLVLHLYWENAASSEPIRTDLPVDLPPEVVAELARFAVGECGAGESGT